MSNFAKIDIFPVGFNPYIINQGIHDTPWNGMRSRVAIDFDLTPNSRNLLSPFDDCEVCFVTKEKNPAQNYFCLKITSSIFIIVVHADPLRLGKFKRGEPFAKCTSHHWHLAMLVNGRLENILNYIVRRPMISKPQLYGTSTHPDGQWSSYKDLTIQINPNQVINNNNNNITTMSQEQINQIIKNNNQSLCDELLARARADKHIFNEFDIPKLEELASVADISAMQIYDRDVRNGRFNQKEEELTIVKQELTTFKQRFVELENDVAHYQSIIGTENEELEGSVEVLRKENRELRERLENNKQGWDWHKWSEGLGKWGLANGGLITIVGFLIAFISDNNAQLSRIIEPSVLAQISVWAGVLQIFLQGLSQNLKKINK